MDKSEQRRGIQLRVQERAYSCRGSEDGGGGIREALLSEEHLSAAEYIDQEYEVVSDIWSEAAKGPDEIGVWQYEDLQVLRGVAF